LLSFVLNLTLSVHIARYQSLACEHNDFGTSLNICIPILFQHSCHDFSLICGFTLVHSNICRNLVKLAEIHIERKELAVARPLLIETVRTCKLYNVSTKSKLVKYSLHLLEGTKKKRTSELNDL